MFNLPLSTKVDRFIPKNSFDSFISARQKKLFAESVSKIRWLNKLSIETINLDGDEIEIFEVQLKQKYGLLSILDTIDRAIPYSIVFVVSFENETLLSVSKKHIHQTNKNQAVVDFRFSTDWFNPNHLNYELTLKKNLNFVLSDICAQISDRKHDKELNIQDLIDKEIMIKQINQKIERLRSQIRNSKQFNSKVELNIKLKELLKKLTLMG